MNKQAHFIGIGGIGVSALARWFLTRKWTVAGSDIAKSKITQELEKEGVKIKIGHKKANLDKKANLVIYNQAIPLSNPEIQEARRLKIKRISYPEALGELTRQYETTAVVGAHGKSTTTAFISLILIKAGFDPTVIIGTRLKQFDPVRNRPPRGGRSRPANGWRAASNGIDPKNSGSNFRNGRSKYLIIEACEWRMAFLHYSPAAAIITNIDREHLDFYKNFSNVKKSFLEFMRKIRPAGLLVLNRDDKNLFGLKDKIDSLARKNSLKIVWYRTNPPSPTVHKIEKILQVPGSHNLSNALAAYTLAKNLGIKGKVILKALNEYSGIWRRLEYRGRLKAKSYKLKALVYDDYAHHPTEIKASLQALREKYPKSRIVCVFQPHQAERLKLLFKDFVSAFQDADNLILLPVYEVPGRDRKSKTFTSEKLAQAISKKKLSPDTIYLKNPGSLRKTINYLITNYKLPELPFTIVMMGAGDIVKYTNSLLK